MMTNAEFIKRVEGHFGHDAYTLLTEYLGSKKPVTVIHNQCGYEYETKAEIIYRGHGCPQCAGILKHTTAKVKQLIAETENGEYELRSEYITNEKPIQIKHIPCGHVFRTTYTLFVTHGSRCPLCNADYRVSESVFLQRIKNIVGDEYSVLGQFKGVSNKVSMKHNTCGHEYEVTPNHFYKGRRCPKCNQSKGEKAVNDMLESLNLTFAREYRISECKNVVALPFDFAVMKNNNLALLIEYQGEQHFKSLEWFGWRESFADRQKKDAIKRNYCLTNRIPLLEIHFEDKNISKTLTTKLKELALI